MSRNAAAAREGHHSQIVDEWEGGRSRSKRAAAEGGSTLLGEEAAGNPRAGRRAAEGGGTGRTGQGKAEALAGRSRLEEGGRSLGEGDIAVAEGEGSNLDSLVSDARVE